ncbi:MAG: NAD-glutamate dehydrogenase domain-containing protein [Polymorphobacter sp.]|uniref:NAD-glutamate dehydrogenase domain-containing protein n=1 Tax=Polymorphobacter sp. TaxID=1909290 RepID=UPI003A870FEA
MPTSATGPTTRCASTRAELRRPRDRRRRQSRRHPARRASSSPAPADALNTDSIDNSAGVDCSDHEVNIKIALGAEVLAGRLDGPARDTLLAEMTDAVAALVLTDNRLQAQALSLAEAQGLAATPRFQRLLQTLEARGGLDRRVEGLADDASISRSAAAGQGFTRPELAVLMAYAKMALTAALSAPEAAPLLDDPALEPDLLAAFPTPMPARFAEAIRSHRLKRELIATELANELVNRGGLPLAFELAEARSASLVDVAAAFVTVRDLFGIRALWAALDDPAISAQQQLALHLHAREALATHMADVLRYAPGRSPATLITTLAASVTRLGEALEGLLGPEPRRSHDTAAARLTALGAPAPLATRLLRLESLDGAIGIGIIASENGLDDLALARAYARLGEVDRARLGTRRRQGAATRRPLGAAAPVQPRPGLRKPAPHPSGAALQARRRARRNARSLARRQQQQRRPPRRHHQPRPQQRPRHTRHARPSRQ